MCCSHGLHELKRLCKNGMLHEALQAADHLLTSQGKLPLRAFHIIEQSCLHNATLECHRLLLRLIVRHKLLLDPVLGCQLIRLFALHDCLPESNQVFNCLTSPNKFAWSAIISANAMLGQGERALELYHRMQNLGMEPDGHVFVAALKGCASARALYEGKQIESDIKESSCKSNTIVANAIIDMYVKCGSLEDACRVFDETQNRDKISWNTLISGHASHGHNYEALYLFSQMHWEGVEPDPATFVGTLKACDKLEYHVDGKLVHAFAVEKGIEPDVRLGNTLIHMYALCGSLEDAFRVFDKMPKNVVETWNAMMSGYIEQKKPAEVFFVFQTMQQKGLQPNRVTFLCIIKACTEMVSIDLGKQVHALVMESPIGRDVTIDNALIDMYAKCGDMEEACWVFHTLAKPVIITWNTLISSLIQHSKAQKAFKYFNEMLQRELQPDQATFVSMLRACLPGIADACCGLQIHAFVVFAGFESETIIANALMDMYTRFSNLRDAQKVFDKLWRRDTVSWNTMMTGYIQHLYNQEASALFQQMQVEGSEPDRATFLCVFKACSDISADDQVNILFHLVIESGFESDDVVQSSLFYMYIKCGSLKNAQWISCYLPKRDLVTWNALIAGYAEHGNGKAVQQLLKSMWSEGVPPDNTTFLSLLATIAHAGSLVEGRLLFQSMQDEYGVVPTRDHFNCLVDLLGRAGHIEEAEDLLQSMPPVPDIVGWTSLLGHCKTHANLEVGRRCYSNFVSLNKEDAAGYVLMWKIFSEFWLEDCANSIEGLLQKVDALTKSRKEFFKS